MTFWTFLKSVPGKITMVATTAVAGIAANFAGASMVKDDLEYEAIKKGVVEGGGTLDGLTEAQILDGWSYVQAEIQVGSGSSITRSIYDSVNSNLDKVPLDSHFQALPIGLTVAAAVILGVIWFVLYRKAMKAA